MIKIYTYSHNRPDLIEPQYESMKRHIKDDFEFIVFNNERAGSNPFSGYKPERIQEINDVCESLGIQCLRVELDPEYQERLSRKCTNLMHPLVSEVETLIMI